MQGDTVDVRAPDEMKRLIVELNILTKRINDAFLREAAATGLSNSAFEILYALYTQGEGCSQKALCDRCLINKQTVNSSLKKLRDQGVVEFHDGHGRETLLFLTEEGRHLVEEKVRPALQREAEVLGQLGAMDREQLLRSMRRYASLLEDRFPPARKDAP